MTAEVPILVTDLPLAALPFHVRPGIEFRQVEDRVILWDSKEELYVVLGQNPTRDTVERALKQLSGAVFHKRYGDAGFSLMIAELSGTIKTDPSAQNQHRAREMLARKYELDGHYRLFHHRPKAA